MGASSMKNNKHIKGIALIALSLLLVFTGIQIEEYLNLQQTSTTAEIEKSVAFTKEFDNYLDELFRQEATANTINLHYTLRNPENFGIEDYPITLGTLSEESKGGTEVGLENIKAVLTHIDTTKLNTDQRLTYDVLKAYIDLESGTSKFYLYQELLRPSTGTQAELPVLMAEYAFYEQKDVDEYLQLLSQMPDYFSQIITFEKKKAAAGLFMPDFAAADIISQCENFIADKENNYLLDTFRDRLAEMDAKISEEEKQDYIDKNHAAVMNNVIPAYEDLILCLKSLSGSAKNQEGLSHLKHGQEYYEYLVRYYTGSDLSVKEMQKATADQRAADMTAAAAIIGKNKELLDQVNVDEVVGNNDPEAILEQLQSKIVKDFPVPPETAYTIKYVHPSLEQHMAPAFYLSVPIDDISQNSIYINNSNNYQGMKLFTTLAHEGFPGHMYQSIMERSKNLPAIRNLLGTSGYAEGWATYVEMISYGYAGMEPEKAALLQLDQSALLSLYASTDMGIHYDGWSLKETQEFFETYQITNKEVIKEIYNLIIEEPGHYLKYYIGYLEFLKLRDYAQKTFGDNYSDYKFHEALLNMGSAPFSVLKKYLAEYYNPGK
jgi:uncharacterized protein (DUF885 family)